MSLDESVIKLHYNINMETPKKAFSKKIRAIRDKKKMTQAEVALKAGITVNYYSRVERGEENPTYDTIMALAKALGVKSSDILPF